MLQFYFHSHYPDVNCNVVSLFEQTFRGYIDLYKSYNDVISNAIVTNKMPSDIIVFGNCLSDVIRCVDDRELRMLILKAFSRYPINEYVDPSIWDENPLDWDYLFDGKNAEDLCFAAKMNWVLYSLPVEKRYCKSQLTVTHRNDEQTICSVRNWFGGKNDDVLSWINEDLEQHYSEIQILASCIFAPHQCVITEDFENQYMNLPIVVQRHINSKLKNVYQKSWLFPSVHADEKLIKECQGDDVKGLYELRNRTYDGLRIYFLVDGNTIYLGGIGFKSISEGKEQTSDMRRALSQINKKRNGL